MDDGKSLYCTPCCNWDNYVTLSICTRKSLTSRLNDNILTTYSCKDMLCILGNRFKATKNEAKDIISINVKTQLARATVGPIRFLALSCLLSSYIRSYCRELHNSQLTLIGGVQSRCVFRVFQNSDIGTPVTQDEHSIMRVYNSFAISSYYTLRYTRTDKDTDKLKESWVRDKNIFFKYQHGWSSGLENSE